ncbi:MAG: ethylbenzene dehydrogenase-related protein [Candidatus Hydrothermarchaeales archaeon]
MIILASFAVVAGEVVERQSTILTAERVTEPVEVDGLATESAWDSARPLVVTVQDGSIGRIDVYLKALYDSDYIYIYATWPDPTESVSKRMWGFNGINWSFSDDEDRFSVFWNIDDSVKGFNVGGCAMLCHGDRMHANAEGEKADSWHWKSSRTNPVGYADDKYVDSHVVPYEGGEKMVGRHGDQAVSGGYMRNINDEGTKPLYYEPLPEDELDALFLLEEEVEDGEAVLLDEAELKSGIVVPGYILSKPSGSRGDIDSKGVWQNERWAVEFRRKLVTGHDDDVQFDTSRTYRFGIAVMDNTGGFEGFGKGHSFDLGARTLEFGGIGSEEVTQLVLIRDYLVTAKAHVRDGKPGLALSEANDGLTLYNEIRDEVADVDPELYITIKNAFVDSVRNPTLSNIDILIRNIDDVVLTFQGKRQPAEPTWNLKLLIAWGRIQLYVFVVLSILVTYPIYKTVKTSARPELRHLSLFLLIVMAPIFLEGVGRFGVLAKIHFLQKFSFTTNEYITMIWAIGMFIALYVAKIGFNEVDDTIKSLGYYSTELETKMEELRKSQAKLLGAEKLASIGQLTASIGHELRNPLGVIKNISYYLDMKLGDRDEKIKKHLRLLDEELVRSNEIISDLLDFSRGIEPTLHDVDINPVVGEALLRATIPGNIEVSTNFEDASPKVSVDSEHIVRVFMNIISNAVQAMPEGGSLRIRTVKKDDFIGIEITDTGVGIPKEDVGKVFEPLFSTKAKGIGLGLAISRQIIERHGGSIEVESVLDSGTTFIVKLPIKRSQGDEGED